MHPTILLSKLRNSSDVKTKINDVSSIAESYMSATYYDVKFLLALENRIKTKNHEFNVKTL